MMEPANKLMYFVMALDENYRLLIELFKREREPQEARTYAVGGNDFGGRTSNCMKSSVPTSANIPSISVQYSSRPSSSSSFSSSPSEPSTSHSPHSKSSLFQKSTSTLPQKQHSKQGVIIGKKSGKPVICYGCGGNHYLSSCPVKTNQHRQGGQKKEGKSPQIQQTTSYSDDEDDSAESAYVSTKAVGLLVSSATPNWIIDTGSTDHVVRDKSGLRNVQKAKRTIAGVVEGVQMKTEEVGDTLMGGGSQIEPKGVIITPKSSSDIVSVQKLVDDGHHVLLSKTGSAIYTGDVQVIPSPSTQIVPIERQSGNHWIFDSGVPTVLLLPIPASTSLLFIGG